MSPGSPGICGQFHFVCVPAVYKRCTGYGFAFVNFLSADRVFFKRACNFLYIVPITILPSSISSPLTEECIYVHVTYSIPDVKAGMRILSFSAFSCPIERASSRLLGTKFCETSTAPSWSIVLILSCVGILIVTWCIGGLVG